MTRMPAAVEMDVAEGAEAEGSGGRPQPSAPRSRHARPIPILKCRRRPSVGAFPRSIGSASSRKPTPARSPASWAPCCVARGCTRSPCYNQLASAARASVRGALQDMRGRRRGPKPRLVDPRVKQLEAENRRLQREAAAGRDDHHAPKKSCRDPGDPPETPRQPTSPTDDRHRGGGPRRAPPRPSVRVSSLARATLYRRRAARPVFVDADPTRGLVARARARRTPGGARRVAQRAVRRSKSPAEVQATLLEEQTYLCSTRTMYRILDAAP